MGVQNVQKDMQKNKFSSKMAKFTGKIQIDISMIFYFHSFFLYDKVNFSNNCVKCVHIFQVFLPTKKHQKMMFITEDAQYSDRSLCIHEFSCAILSF